MFPVAVAVAVAVVVVEVMDAEVVADTEVVMDTVVMDTEVVVHVDVGAEGGELGSATNFIPSKVPTIYCVPEPVTPGGPPGLSPICITHLVLASSPSTASGKRLGHSQTPPTAFQGPNSLA
jgi:hypothetical protein